MVIKYAVKEDISAIAAVEAECFPPTEAATEKEFIERVKYYGNHFWLLYEGVSDKSTHGNVVWHQMRLSF